MNYATAAVNKKSFSLLNFLLPVLLLFSNLSAQDIQIFSPHNGDSLKAGILATFNFTAGGLNPIVLTYSSDNGTSWVEGGSTPFPEFGVLLSILPSVPYDTLLCRLYSPADTTIGDTITITTYDSVYWHKVNLNNIFAVEALKSNIVFAAGPGGIFRTSDNGKTWDDPLLPGYNFRDIFFLDNCFGWVSGLNNTLFKTGDGGKTWRRLNVDSVNNPNLNKIFFITPQNGFALTEKGVYKTTNNGASWLFSQPDDNPEANHDKIQFIDDQTGWIAVDISNDDYRFYKTTDGGNTWNKLFSINAWSGERPGLFFIDLNTGWVSASNHIYKTTDGGTNWTKQENLIITTPFRLGEEGPRSAASIFFIDHLTGWTAGTAGLILKTTNGGDTWIEEGTGTGVGFSFISFQTEIFGWAVAHNELFNHDDIAVQPVNLLMALADPKKIILSWTAIYEESLLGFEIEKSSNNIDWKKIAFISAGDISKNHKYIYEDKMSYGARYRLRVISNNGDYYYTDVVEVSSITSVSGNYSEISYSLSQNYPNPFNPVTTIKYSIKEPGWVKLNVFNVMGEMVSSLVNEMKEEGEHVIQFNASALSSGIYFYSIESNGFSALNKMILLK